MNMNPAYMIKGSVVLLFKLPSGEFFALEKSENTRDLSEFSRRKVEWLEAAMEAAGNAYARHLFSSQIGKIRFESFLFCPIMLGQVNIDNFVRQYPTRTDFGVFDLVQQIDPELSCISLFPESFVIERLCFARCYSSRLLKEDDKKLFETEYIEIAENDDREMCADINGTRFVIFETSNHFKRIQIESHILLTFKNAGDLENIHKDNAAIHHLLKKIETCCDYDPREVLPDVIFGHVEKFSGKRCKLIMDGDIEAVDNKKYHCPAYVGFRLQVPGCDETLEVSLALKLPLH